MFFGFFLIHNNKRDGAFQTHIYVGRPSYLPKCQYEFENISSRFKSKTLLTMVALTEDSIIEDCES